jgi:SnoaL-like domain
VSNKTSARDVVIKKGTVLTMALAFLVGISTMPSAFGNSEDETVKKGAHPREDNKVLIKQMFRDVIEADAFDEQAVARYFSPKYVQRVDGKTLDFAGFSDHLHAVKGAVTNVRVTFEQMVAEGNMVMDIHRVEADKRAGGKLVSKVIALFVIEDRKVIFCEELTHLEEGAATDKDLGSRSSKP